MSKERGSFWYLIAFVTPFFTMPFTAEEKRKRRADKAISEGKIYKSRKHPCLREPPPPCEAPPASASSDSPEPKLTMEEEMNRKAMEVEDCRTRMQSVMQASASLLSFYNVWLMPGQEVRLRPHYEKLLDLERRRRGALYRLVHQARDGMWKLSVARGPYKGKDLFINVPAEALMP
jgi:hypothetical protein